MMSPVPHALTASRVSVTKAGGLSDAPGAERSLNGKDGDTVTHVTCTCRKTERPAMTLAAQIAA